ncbi:MAG: EAL domain-containing protein [Campylobacterota bacterium]|nr:EAL domain-containing protein [Campylobacterota bacterium]
MPFKLSDLKEHNSELLKLLTHNLPDMLWVKDLEGKYIYANKAICDGLLMAKDINEPIGKGDVFFALREREAHKDKPDWHTFGELCFNSDLDVIKHDKAMKFEEYGNVKGKLFYLEVYKAPFYDKDGKTIGTVGAGRDITKLKKIQSDLEKSLKILDLQREQLEYQANHDSLTGLANRILFMDRLQQSINLAQINNKKVAVLFIDLDHFKEINDSLGHHIGDKVLVEVTKRINNRMKKSDTLSRLGGDEFCIILNDVEELENLSEIILQWKEDLKEAISINNNTMYIGMSVGISIYPNDGKNGSTLLQNADAAMYKAKDDGRNTYCFYDEEMTKKAHERVFLETALREAFLNDELVVYFQAQINAKDNKIVGMEALVRWQHPTMGLIAPYKFINLAEVTGMIVELDRIVMKKAIKEFSLWNKDGLNPGKLSMNLAIKQIEEEDFIDFIEDLLEDKECLAECIELEVTETQIMNNPDKSIKVLEEINKMGISIVIDDFGTGYSSLAYLKRLPIDKLKIDKSFVDGLPSNSDDVAIAKTIISLSKNLNLKVIAEGVETENQKDFLVENGCDLIQGYLYSRPIPANEMREFLINY